MQDPILQEIRQIRHQFEESCQNDPHQLSEYWYQIQKKYQDRLVCRSPQKRLVITSRSES